MKSLHIVVILGLLGLSLVFPSGVRAQANPSGGSTNSFSLKDAQPYTLEEFPQWAHDLRRFEIISIGSFPLAWIASSVFYDIGRYGFLLAQGDPTASTYAPLFFGPPTKPLFTTEENYQVFAMAGVLSLGIGILDWYLESKERRSRSIQQAQEIPIPTTEQDLVVEYYESESPPEDPSRE